MVLSGLHRQPLEMRRKAGFIEVIGRANLVAQFDDALARARVVLDEEPRLSGGWSVRAEAFRSLERAFEVAGNLYFSGV